MAKIIQIIATDTENKYFEAAIVNNDWHAVLTAHGPRTVCGIQLDGDDGYGPGPTHNGIVTCSGCLAIIVEIKAIKCWKKATECTD